MVSQEDWCRLHITLSTLFLDPDEADRLDDVLESSDAVLDREEVLSQDEIDACVVALGLLEITGISAQSLSDDLSLPGPGYVATREGTGSARTMPFELEAGDYLFWVTAHDADRSDKTGCRLDYSLETVGSKRRQAGLRLRPDPGRTVGESARVIGLLEGRYFFDVDSNCDNWAFTVEPLRW